MTTKTHHLASLALSLVMTLGLFSSVTGLSAPSHAGPLLAKAATAAPRA